ncbi:MAG: adenylate/guanylate cyclase domain-containing protein, partial [Sphaerospermopsis kisseleviana]
MKMFTFRSIRTQILTSTTLLILGLIGAIVTVWVKSENTLYRQEKLNDAKSMSKILSYTYSNELSQENWSQIRLNIDLILRENEDFVYVFVTDKSEDNQIAAAYPKEYQNQYIPDLIPLSVTEKAITESQNTRIIETFGLKNIYFADKLRIKRGQPIIEVASDIQTLAGKKLGTLRIGMSLQKVDRAITNAVNQAL